MSEKHILCGFDVPEFEKMMKVLLKEKGIEATTYTQLSKKGVIDFLEQNPKCDTVILLEASNFKKSYTAEEVAALTDKREINVIIVLSSRHIGTDYMKTLYVAGVTNAIFQMGRKDGASAKDIVERIVHKRNRQEARKYYGIEHLDLDPTVMMDRDTYAECLKRLHKEEHLLINYLQVCAELSPKQIADFTMRIPAEDREYLAQFEEFHMLMDAIRKLGVVIKIKRPRKTTVGMKVTPQIQVSKDEIIYRNHEELFHMPKRNQPLSDSGSEILDENTASDTAQIDERFYGMSMEALLVAAQNDFLLNEEDESGTDSGENMGEASKAALEEAKRLQAEAVETHRNLVLEQERLERERRDFEDSKKEAEKELRREEKRIQKEAEEVENRIRKTKAEEEATKRRKEQEAREEVKRRIKEEAERVKRKEMEKQSEEETELYTSEKQFSGGFLVGLLLLCAVVAVALFAIPYLKHRGIF